MPRRLSFFGCCAVVVLCLALPVPASAAKPYVVEANGSFPADLAAKVHGAGGSLTAVHDEIGMARATSDDPNFAAKLAATANVSGVYADKLVQWTPSRKSFTRTAALPSSTTAGPNPSGAFFFKCQWNLTQIDAPGAWAQGVFGSPEVKVAVLDTGTDPTHIDLAGRIDTEDSTSVLTPGTSPCGPSDETSFVDQDFHGTFVSSLITSNSRGIAAVAPKTKVVAVKVLNCAGSGTFGDVAAGLHYAAKLHDVGVINMSLGALIPKAGNEDLIRFISKAVDFATDRGKLVVSAAGNSGVDLGKGSPFIEVPAQSDGGIGVEALAIDRSLASYSNFGVTTFLDAPGGDLPDPFGPLPGCPLPPSVQPFESLVIGACLSSFCGGNNFYLLGAGTSFASPLVAGVAELVDSTQGDEISPEHLRHILDRTATKLGDPHVFGKGEVNASKAVQTHGEDNGGDD